MADFHAGLGLRCPDALYWVSPLLLQLSYANTEEEENKHM